VEYGVLGSLRLAHDGLPIEVTAAKQRTLFLYLLLHRNEVAATDALAEAVWPAGPPASAPKLLQLYVSKLRNVLPAGLLETCSPGYVLRVAPRELDSERFERLLEDGRAVRSAGNARLAAALFRRALGLWRGPAFADAAYENFAIPEAARLEELRLACLEERITADLELGRHQELVGELTALVAERPLREGLRGRLMLALYRAGRQTEALEAFTDVRRALRRELGLEPGEELRSLQAAILRHDPVLAAPADTGPGTLPLPHPATPLIGRDDDLAALLALVGRDHVRLVSLVGAGGSGKTRLALALAHRLSTAFADGAAFIELHTLRDPDLVLPTIARRLGLAEQPGRTPADLLAGWLRERELLLVLDNLEQLLSAAPALTALLAGAPRLRVVATSRAVLHVSGEHVFPVSPLSLDAAAELFAARAEALDPRFRLEPVRDQIRRICERVDCLPLAVELAAAHTRTLSPAALSELLAARVTSLAGGPRDLPARQQTLRDTLRWSTDLLPETVRGELARLGVFSGGWTAEAASRVADASRLDVLVDCSLVQRRDDERFSMLETVREHALELLATERTVYEERHAAHYLELAERAAAQFFGARHAAALDLLDAERDNLNAALENLHRPGSADEEIRLAAALWHYWWTRGLATEGRRRLAHALTSDELEPHPARTEALRGAAVLAERQLDLDAAHALAEQARIRAAQAHDALAEGRALLVLGNVATDRRELPAATRFQCEAIERFREQDNRLGQAIGLLNLGWIELIRRRFADSAGFSRQSLQLFRACGDDAGAATVLCNLGLATLGAGALDEAQEHLRQSLELGIKLGFIERIANTLEATAAALSASGAHEQAATYLGTAAALRKDAGSPLDPYEADLHEQTERAILAALGRTRFDQLFHDGSHQTWDVLVQAL